jgi:hypothetical protein
MPFALIGWKIFFWHEGCGNCSGQQSIQIGCGGERRDMANILRLMQRHLLALFFAAPMSIPTAAPVQAAESYEPGLVQFSACDAVSDQRLSTVSGTGGGSAINAPRTKVSVILWDEPPASASGGTTAPDHSNTSQSIRASVNSR